MRKKRILLFSEQRLLGESVEQTLRQSNTLELAGHWCADDTILERLQQAAPDLVILADEGKMSEDWLRLTACILDQHPDLPVLRVTLERNQVQIYSSHRFPASSHELIDLIQSLPLNP